MHADQSTTIKIQSFPSQSENWLEMEKKKKKNPQIYNRRPSKPTPNTARQTQTTRGTNTLQGAIVENTISIVLEF
jgi:hypothetical protein